ncbi:hypothetical protein Ga0466249_004326 [Sporomusaceae bacterium BoRhaA]|nr:hypothetical protein [Pelorhabdus rhamnosifermentans]
MENASESKYNGWMLKYSFIIGLSLGTFIGIIIECVVEYYF